MSGGRHLIPDRSCHPRISWRPMPAGSGARVRLPARAPWARRPSPSQETGPLPLRPASGPYAPMACYSGRKFGSNQRHLRAPAGPASLGHGEPSTAHESPVRPTRAQYAPRVSHEVQPTGVLSSLQNQRMKATFCFGILYILLNTFYIEYQCVINIEY